MVIQFSVFLLGLVVLYFGAEWLVKAASSIALKFGIRPMIIGLTVVALGTSMPEFLLNAFALFSGADDLAVGNIIGSNIANIGLILGVSVILMPIAIDRKVLRREYPMMVAATLLFYALAADGLISRIDGAILSVGLISFFLFVVFNAREPELATRSKTPDATPEYRDESRRKLAENRRLRAAYLIAGSIALTIGARLMVSSAVHIADMLDVAPVFVGLTIVAIGTSLPELAAAIVLARQNESEMSLGNVLGSNMLNILFVVGVISLVRPISVSPVSVTQHFPVMIAFTLGLYPLARYGEIMTDSAGFVLLMSYVAYLGWLVFPYI